MTTTPDPYPDVFQPADAVKIGEWDGGERYFECRSWDIDSDGEEFDAFRVMIAGVQQSAGPFRRHIVLDWDGSRSASCISRSQARQLASALVEVTNELDSNIV